MYLGYNPYLLFISFSNKIFHIKFGSFNEINFLVHILKIRIVSQDQYLLKLYFWLIMTFFSRTCWCPYSAMSFSYLWVFFTIYVLNIHRSGWYFQNTITVTVKKSTNWITNIVFFKMEPQEQTRSTSITIVSSIPVHAGCIWKLQAEYVGFYTCCTDSHNNAVFSPSVSDRYKQKNNSKSSTSGILICWLFWIFLDIWIVLIDFWVCVFWVSQALWLLI